MRNLINQRVFGRNSTFRLLALAASATGAGIFYANNRDNDAKSLSVPSQFRDYIWTPWKNIQFAYSSVDSAFTPSSGYFPLNFARASPAPLPPSADKASGEIPDDSGKCGHGCIGRYTFAKAAAMVAPAVVHLSITQDFGGMTLGKGIGSGTIVDPDGTILTCAHAVADFQCRGAISKGKIDVTLQDGRTFEGTVVNADFCSDIATVKIKSKTPLPMAKLGSSRKLIPGEPVLSLGCPLSLQNTLTAGIVSCVDRKSSDMGLGGLRREFLQTDCPINQGNSGGPLVNLDGEVVGVNTIKVSDANGLGFAVPIDTVSKILEQFKKHGRVVRPWLGLKMLDLNEMIIAQLKERDITFPDVNKGVLIPMVTPDSPASCAGFLSGDVVIEFDGKPVESIKEIVDIMGDKIGKPLKVVVKRANNSMVTLTVVPEEGYPDM